MATEPRSTTAPCVDGELMPQRQVLEDEISAGADRCEECCDKQTEVEHRRASRGSPILCYLSIEPHLSGFAVPREGAREAEAHAEAILDARITSGGMELIVEAGPSCRRSRLQCGQVIAISSSLRGRGYAMLLEP